MTDQEQNDLESKVLLTVYVALGLGVINISLFMFVTYIILSGK